MDYEQVKRYMAEDVIEVVPLAYMRGRTLNNAFIIMDEAQNTTVSQMKMFLTRMGWNSKVVVSGDTSQVDLPPHTKSGLIDAIGRLRDIEGYANIVLGQGRHRAAPTGAGNCQRLRGGAEEEAVEREQGAGGRESMDSLLPAPGFSTLAS